MIRASPPGRRTRAISASAAGMSGVWWRTPLLETRIEACVGEGQCLGVARLDRCVEADRCKMGSRELHVARGQIDSRRRRASLRITRDVDALAAADVQHVEPGRPGVIEFLGHPWRVFVAGGQQASKYSPEPGSPPAAFAPQGPRSTARSRPACSPLPPASRAATAYQRESSLPPPEVTPAGSRRGGGAIGRAGLEAPVGDDRSGPAVASSARRDDEVVGAEALLSIPVMRRAEPPVRVLSSTPSSSPPSSRRRPRAARSSREKAGDRPGELILEAPDRSRHLDCVVHRGHGRAGSRRPFGCEGAGELPARKPVVPRRRAQRARLLTPKILDRNGARGPRPEDVGEEADGRDQHEREPKRGRLQQPPSAVQGPGKRIPSDCFAARPTV